jgi:hypothetical protein
MGVKARIGWVAFPLALSFYRNLPSDNNLIMNLRSITTRRTPLSIRPPQACDKELPR